jgi:hypothetical protein
MSNTLVDMLGKLFWNAGFTYCVTRQMEGMMYVPIESTRFVDHWLAQHHDVPTRTIHLDDFSTEQFKLYLASMEKEYAVIKMNGYCRPIMCIGAVLTETISKGWVIELDVSVLFEDKQDAIRYAVAGGSQYIYSPTEGVHHIETNKWCPATESEWVFIAGDSMVSPLRDSVEENQ